MEKNNSIISTYRSLYIVGGFIAFISCFIDWYNVEIYNEMEQVILESSYNLFLGWTIIDHIYPGALNDFYPSSSLLPLEFLYFHLGLIVLSVFITLLKVNPASQDSQKSKYKGYLLLTTGFLTLIVISLVSFELIFREAMYLPTIIINNQEFDVIIHQNIGIGFILHAFSFILFFPMAWFQFKFDLKFEILMKNPDSKLKPTNEFNLDALIAEENAKLNSEGFGRNMQLEKDVGAILSNYQAQRRLR